MTTEILIPYLTIHLFVGFVTGTLYNLYHAEQKYSKYPTDAARRAVAALVFLCWPLYLLVLALYGSSRGLRHLARGFRDLYRMKFPRAVLPGARVVDRRR